MKSPCPLALRPLLALLSLGTLQAWAQSDSCVPQNEFVALPPSLAGSQTDSFGKRTVALGSYERVSPDGRFILRSYSGARLGDVSLIELGVAPAAVVRIISTPLSNEAFPVQGTWRYLVSTSGEHYAFKDIVTQAQTAKPLFKGGMTGFYAAAAELKTSPQPLLDKVSSSTNLIKIRSFSWPNASGDSLTQGEGALAVRTITVDTAVSKITADSGHQNICGERARLDGVLYALPMISIDGEEFAALPQMPVQGKQTMRIYGFGASGRGCEARANFDFASGKAIFGFPDTDSTKPAPSAHLAYEYKGQAWWFNRALNQPFNIAPYLAIDSPIQRLDASAFPGITADGRVIYAATWERCTPSATTASAVIKTTCESVGGYVVSDPWQSNAYRQYLLDKNLKAPKACITHADVAQQRQAFAAFHGLAN
jgi:hypothetical protein